MTKPNRTRPLVDVLKEDKMGMSPEALLSRAGYSTDTIDAFYQELREAVRSGLVAEKREGQHEILLTLV